MSFRHLLFNLTVFLTFCNTLVLQSQNSNFVYFSPDSLKGFDEGFHKKAASQEGLSSVNYITYMNRQKRAYIDEKYALRDDYRSTGYFFTSAPKGFGNTNQVNASPCNNEGFESNSFASWTIDRGVNINSATPPTYTALNISASSEASIMTTPITDPIISPFVGQIPNSPLGGTRVARISNPGEWQDAKVIRISQTFPVTLTNYIYQFAYWAVMQNSSSHNCQQTPYMSVRIRRFTGNLESCPNFSIAAPSIGGCAGLGPLTWNTVGTGTNNVRTSTGWQRFALDLTPYLTDPYVTIEVLVAHCNLGQHYGYAYFDSNCSTMDLTVNTNSIISMPYSTVNVQATCGQAATLTAPYAFNPYLWNGPSGSFISNNTNTTIVTSVAGNYTLGMSPVGICNAPMTKVITLSFPPPTTLVASPSVICSGGGVTASTLSIVGAAGYTWTHNGSNSSSVVVSPTSTTVYTVAVQTGTCIGTRTIEVQVTPSPTLTVGNSNPVMCAGGVSTLSAVGASTFIWTPGNLAGSSVTVSPVSTQVYTVTGTTPLGCVDTETTLITVSTTTALTVLVLSPPSASVCSGGAVSILGAGGGGGTYTWIPSDGGPILVTSNVINNFNPTVTTTYTIIGGVGSCTTSTTTAILVDQGPPITIAATPTITCPGGSATLTATAPAAVGAFTWNPGGTVGNPLTVSPSSTTVYSVTARNNNGCPRTVSITKLVAPTPTITFAPASPTVCFGSALTLTASGGTSYTWTAPAPIVNTATRVVTPTVNTTYSITASNGACTSNSSIQVTVVPTPTVIASVSPTAICRGSVATLSATGASTYTWMPGTLVGATRTVSPLNSTTYTVTGTSGLCSSSRTVALVVFPLPTVNVVTTATSVCPGNCATLTPSGALNYTVSPGNSTVVCPSSTTTYSIAGITAQGCRSASDRTITIVVNPTPSITFSPASPSICAGGTINVTALGGTSYTWNTGGFVGATRTLSANVTTVYTVTATNGSGCISTATIQLQVVPNPTVIASVSPTAICRGSVASLTASGATTFTWMPGTLTGPTRTVSPTNSTIYTVTGTSSLCSSSRTVSLIVFPLPTVNVIATATSVCPGNCVTLTPSGALNYTVSPGNNTVVCPSSTTTYSIAGITAQGCRTANDATITIVVNPTPSITFSPASPSICVGGSINVTAFGGTSFTWNPGGFVGATRTLSNTTTTIYTVTAVNASGCTSTATVQLLVLPNPTITVSASPSPICRGAVSTLSASGATTYTWLPGPLTGPTPTVSPTNSTIYTVTGTSAGCTGTRTIGLVVFPLPTVNVASSASAVCPGNCATLTTSGALNYTILPGNSRTVCPTTTTTYSISGITAQGCRTANDATITIVVNPTPSITFSPASPSICVGGSINVTALGGTSFTWNTGGFVGATRTLSNTTTTIYTVTAVNASGCTSTATVQLLVLPNPTITASASPSPICRGAVSTLSASGANTYTWLPGPLTGPTPTVSPTNSTIYTVTGTSAGCTGTRTIGLVVFPLPTVNVVSSASAVCPGNCATLTTSGALNYTILPGNSRTVCPTTTTTYSISGITAQGCRTANDATITISVNPTPTVLLTPSTASICAGSSVNILASGAASYTWNPGPLTGTTQNLSPSVTTVYIVSGANAGCASTTTIQITVIQNPTVSVSGSPTNICSGVQTTLTASGAASYTWMPINSTLNPVTVTPSATTVYTVTGATGACTGSRTLQINVNPTPTIIATATPTAICMGATTSLSATGAASYTWSGPGVTTGSLVTRTPVVTSQYTVIGATSGCTALATVIVTVNPIPSVTIAASSSSVCRGSAVTLTASGAGSFTWMPGSSTINPAIFTPTVSTTYTATGASLGCSSQATINIQVIPITTISALANSATICAGGSSTLTATGSGNYTWTPGGLIGGTQVVSPTVTTVYSVNGSSLGCPSVAGSATVNVNSLPSILLSSSSTLICAGTNATISAGGANNYTLTPGNLTGSFIPVNPTVTTTYTVRGINANGCIGQNTITIAVVPLPNVTVTPSSTVICRTQSTTLTASGAASYFWIGLASFSNSVVVQPSVTTVYTVVGTISSCSRGQTVQVTVNPTPTINVAATSTQICLGTCVTLSGSGAVSYTYPANNPVVCPTVTTTYSVSGTNAFGCVSSPPGTITIVVNPIPSITLTPSSASICAGSSVTVIASGASAYSWNPGPLTGASQSLSPSLTTIYTVTGSAAGCSSTRTIQILVVPNPVVTATATPSTICIGSTATLSASGATSYVWAPGGQTVGTITVSPGSTQVYSVTGSTAGCSNTRTVQVTVNNSSPVLATASATSICQGQSVTLTSSGASTYTWLPVNQTGSTTAVTPTASTVYTVNATNSSGCISSNTVSVTVNPNPTVTAAINPTTTICAGTGFTLSATGGASSYTWTSTMFTPIVGQTVNIGIGTATVTTFTVTGSLGTCTSSATRVLTISPTPTITASASPSAICIGQTSTLTANGGVTYTWTPLFMTPISNAQTLTVSPTGPIGYEASGSNNLGCTSAATVFVSVNPLPTITVIASQTAICPGNCATLTAAGAQTYTYPANIPVVCPTITTTYTVGGTSAAGCVAANPGSVTIVVYPAPQVSIQSQSLCVGSTGGFTVTSLTPGPHSYTWMPGPLTGSVISVSPTITTIYTLTAQTASGCSQQFTASLFVAPNPTVTASASPTTVCFGGQVVLNATGASTYSWSPIALAVNPVTVNPTSTQIYTVTGTSTLNCSSTNTVLVTVNPLPALNPVASPSNICAGFCSTLSASGATSYTWLPNSTGSTLVACPPSNAIYTVTGISAAGCVNSETVAITVSPNPTINIVASSTTICSGSTATLVPTGATSYTWLPGPVFGGSLSVNPTVTTIYTVTGANGNCTSSATIAINVNPNPTVTVNASPSSICIGSSATLTATGGANYTWTPGPQTGSNVVVSPTINTTYTVLTDNLFGCTTTQTVDVAVNSAPTVSITSTSNTICSGNSATLTGSGTLSYTWSPGTQTTSAIMVNPTSTTVYTLFGYNGPGCFNTATFTLNVSTTPTVVASAASASVCEGYTTSLTASGALTYTWMPGNLTGSMVTVTPTISTTYTVEGDNAGCLATTTVAVFAIPLPTISVAASPTAVCVGSSVTLTANGAQTYTWLPLGLAVATVTDSPLVTTTYTAIGLAATGCTNLASITVSVLSIPNITVVSSGTTVCSGSSTTLTAAGATSYTWEPGTLTGSTVTVNPTTPTIYTVTGDNGACSSTATISIGINPLPVLTATITPTVVCEGSPVNLTASGANNYTWLPSGLTGSNVVDNPTITLTYTVTGEDANGCLNTANISVSVNPNPILVATPSATGICIGNSVTLTASGADTFTWMPGSNTATTITESPTITTTYTLSGTDAIGCIGSSTIQIGVFPTPTVTASPLTSTICFGTSATLTASGATSYTWLPSGNTGSLSVESPTINTTYTVIGDNGGVCFNSFTVDISVTPLPANVTATVSGTITCASPSVDLSASTTDTDVIYSWAGPSAFSSTVQNPSGITVWGTYTLMVTNTITGCMATATIDVPTDGSIPSVTATTSGSITCASSSVTLNAIVNSTNTALSFSWTGPSAYTAITQSAAAISAGDYTVVVTDPNSSCTGSAVVTVGSHTEVVVTATITAATCSAGVSNNNGTILVSNFAGADRFDLVEGTTYTGSVTYTNAASIATTGILIDNLANPTVTTPYTLRIFDSLGCEKDYVLILEPVDCELRPLGLAKSVSTPTTNEDGTYDVEYTVVVANTDADALTQVVVLEDLALTFPLPSTFSVMSLDSSAAGGIKMNNLFNGTTNKNLTFASSSIAATTSHTLSFVVRVTTNGIFGPFSNTVSATATNSLNIQVSDVSNNELIDPDNDKNPKNNSDPTIVTFTPDLFFGVTKQGSFMKLDNNSYDITYSVAVHNLGNDTLRNIVITDSLLNKTIKQPATYSIRSAPGATGGLQANASFNGGTDVNLIETVGSKLAPKTTATVTFVINVINDTVRVISNSARGSASHGTITLADISNDGIDPDSNNNGIWNEEADNMPTILILPPTMPTVTHSLFIPEGFSPDGDGINDLFVIKGLPEGENTITIFNRWGNRVYYHSNYDNNWNGYPNVAGTMGRNKLPQGTYYYVLDMKGSGAKPVTGFIILQYRD